MASELPPVDEGLRELDVRVGLGSFASEDQLGHLLAIARQVDVEAGQELYRQGMPVTTLFQLMSGEIELVVPAAPSWRIAGTGTAGLLDFLHGPTHARTAVAVTASRLLELDAVDYRDYLEDNFDVCYRLISQLSAEIATGVVALPEARELLAGSPRPPGRSFAKVEIPVVERLMMLSRVEVLRGASMQGLANLAQSATEARFAPGELITTAGARPGVVSILVEGAVQLELPDGVRVTRAGLDLVAHLEELAVTPRLATVIAMTPAIVLQIELEELLDRIEEHFDLATSIFAFLAREQERLNDCAASAGVPLGTDWK